MRWIPSLILFSIPVVLLVWFFLINRQFRRCYRVRFPQYPRGPMDENAKVSELTTRRSAEDLAAIFHGEIIFDPDWRRRRN